MRFGILLGVLGVLCVIGLLFISAMIIIPIALLAFGIYYLWLRYTIVKSGGSFTSWRFRERSTTTSSAGFPQSDKPIIDVEEVDEDDSAN